MNRYSSLIKNIGLFTLSNISTKFISFFLVPFYTYYLTTKEYGTSDLMNTTVSLLVPLLTLSISDGVLRYSFDKMLEKRKVFSNGLWLSVFSSIVLLIFLPIFNFVPGISNYKFLFWLLFLTNTFTVLFSNFSRALNLVSLISITSIINTLLTATLNIVLIGGFKLGLLGFLLANILGNIIGCFIYYFAGKFKNYTVFSIDIPLLKQMFVYCLPLIPNALFWWINSSINRYFLTILTSLSAVGLFSVANKIPSILSMVTGIFQQAWDISSIEVYDSKERDTFFSNIFNAYTFLMGLVSILLIVANKFIAVILLKKAFISADVYIPWMIIAFYYSSLNSFYGSIYIASKKTKYLFTTTILGAVSSIFFNYILILKFGIMGAAVATIISNFIVWIARLIDSRKLVNIRTSYIRLGITQAILVILAINMGYSGIYRPYVSAISIIIYLIMYRKRLIQISHTLMGKFK